MPRERERESEREQSEPLSQTISALALEGLEVARPSPAYQ